MRHPVEVTHLVMGLVFLGIAAAWGAGAAGLVDVGRTSWLLPLVLVVAGVAGLAASLAGRRDQGADRDPPHTGDGAV